MADLNAPDYYEQVSVETKKELAEDKKRILDRVGTTVKERFPYLQEEIAREFGWAVVRSANMKWIENEVLKIAFAVSSATKSVMIDNQIRETQKSEGVMLNAVLAGIKIGSKYE